MKSLTLHDLLVVLYVSAGINLVALILQIVVVSKATVPADEAVIELRLLKNEAAHRQLSIDTKLSNIEAALDSMATRHSTLQRMEPANGYVGAD